MTCGRVEILWAAFATLAALGTTACGGKSCAAIPCPAPGGFDQSTCACVSGSLPPSGGGAGAGGAGLGGVGSGGGTGFGGAGGSGEAGTGGLSCAQGQSSYQEFSQTQIAQDNSCIVDSDCVAVYETNDCSANGCGDRIALNVSAQMSVVSTLGDYAADHCATCPPLAPESCVGIAAVVSCVNGLCTFVSATSF
jgi:hypothetical protein